jgi:hypothetical protein
MNFQIKKKSFCDLRMVWIPHHMRLTAITDPITRTTIPTTTRLDQTTSTTRKTVTTTKSR